VEVIDLPLPGLKLIKPRLFRDERGHFTELMHGPRYAEAGLPSSFVQDNLSHSRRNVLRGLHYQHPRWQGKLITAVEGVIFDVAVDLRRGSPTFGKWYGQELSGEDHVQIYVPVGFAHGFCVMSETASVHYKCTELYDPASEQTILATDPDLAIRWPCSSPILSPKDAAGRRFKDVGSGLSYDL
jgi:dTDP-4-dehydrorhamnose 3,5-epimerase